MVEPVETHFPWRPQLRDPADEFVLEVAVHGRAAGIDIREQFPPAAYPIPASFPSTNIPSSRESCRARQCHPLLQQPASGGPVWNRRTDTRRSNPENQDMKSQSTYPLRLQRSVKAEVERRAKQDGTSVNQFVATVAEKLAAMGTGEFFAERRTRADFTAFDRLMQRKRGEPPAPDDTIG
jgi:hypothetical protein